MFNPLPPRINPSPSEVTYSTVNGISTIYLPVIYSLLCNWTPYTLPLYLANCPHRSPLPPIPLQTSFYVPIYVLFRVDRTVATICNSSLSLPCFRLVLNLKHSFKRCSKLMSASFNSPYLLISLNIIYRPSSQVLIYLLLFTSSSPVLLYL